MNTYQPEMYIPPKGETIVFDSSRGINSVEFAKLKSQILAGPMANLPLLVYIDEQEPRRIFDERDLCAQFVRGEDQQLIVNNERIYLIPGRKLVIGISMVNSGL